VKKVVLLIALLALVVFPAALSAQDSVGDYPIGNKGWALDVSTSIPVMKIVESSSENADMDVLPVAGFGAGLCIYWADVNVPDHDKIVSINLPMLYLSTRFDDEKKLDLTVAGTLGFFDDLLSIGLGYETGALPYERSRWVGLLSFGVQF
jgi:hypothetical protein